MSITHHLDFLGKKIRDKVSGVEGVVTSVSFDLYGCIQAVINRGVDKDGKQIESIWLDVGRLNVTDDTPVMPRPHFEWTPQAIAEGEKGPSEKPARAGE